MIIRRSGYCCIEFLCPSLQHATLQAAIDFIVEANISLALFLILLRPTIYSELRLISNSTYSCHQFYCCWFHFNSIQQMDSILFNTFQLWIRLNVFQFTFLFPKTTSHDLWTGGAGVVLRHHWVLWSRRPLCTFGYSVFCQLLLILILIFPCVDLFVLCHTYTKSFPDCLASNVNYYSGVINDIYDVILCAKT